MKNRNADVLSRIPFVEPIITAPGSLAAQAALDELALRLGEPERGDVAKKATQEARRPIEQFSRRVSTRNWHRPLNSAAETCGAPSAGRVERFSPNP
jgi:hypothetical protein